MNEASRTALGVAYLRSVHQLYDGEPKILDDPIAARLVPPPAVTLSSPSGDAADRNALRAHVLIRSRFAEDRLGDAVASGVRQYVVLGAGYDTFAYRLPAWAHGLRVIEVDHPATQADKRTRLARAGIAIPSALAFAPVDFTTTSLDEGLAAAGVDREAPAFFSWLGVIPYLDREAIEAVFRTVAAFPSPSEIAFTYAQRGDTPTARRAAAAGEPFRSAFSPDAIAALIRRCGLDDVTLLDARTVTARYLAGRSDALRAAGASSSIGAARRSA